MRVSLERDVLNSKENYYQLNDILHFFESGRHNWEISNIPELENSGWFNHDPNGITGERIRELFKKVITKSVYEEENDRLKVIACLNPSDRNQLKPEELKNYLAIPSYVLMENNHSDGLFVSAMIHIFDRRILKLYYDKGWLEWKKLGGKNELEKDLIELSDRINGPLRLCVITDSDRSIKDEETNNVKYVKRCCIPRNIKYHILEKREIENYIPLNLITDEQLKSLNKHTKEQIEFINKRDEFLELAQLDRDYKKLKKLFNKDFYKLFNFKDSFTVESVRQWCSSNPEEIPEILDIIETIL